MVLCFTWWFRVSGVSMGRKVLSDVHGASPVLFETGLWDLLYKSGPFGPLLPSLPSLWQDQRISGKERHLVLLWDRL